MKEENIKEVKEEVKVEGKEEVKQDVKLREIIIKTDGNNIQIEKAEVGGKIELIGVLQNVINYINQLQQK